MRMGSLGAHRKRERWQALGGGGPRQGQVRRMLAWTAGGLGTHVGISLVTPRPSRGQLGKQGKMVLPVSWALSPSGPLPSWRTLANADLPVQLLPVMPTPLIQPSLSHPLLSHNFLSHLLPTWPLPVIPTSLIQPPVALHGLSHSALNHHHHPYYSRLFSQRQPPQYLSYFSCTMTLTLTLLPSREDLNLVLCNYPLKLGGPL